MIKALESAVEFSPHPWGWTGHHPAIILRSLVFPTPVGMDRADECVAECLKRFPHTRGDGPVVQEGTT